MTVVITLSREERDRLHDAFIDEQIALAGYMETRAEATQALRHYAQVLRVLLEKYEIEPHETYEVDNYVGAIALRD